MSDVSEVNATESPKMAGVIERLRKSKEDDDAAEFKSGQEYGRRWAEKTARAGELKRIQRCQDSHEDMSNSPFDWDWLFSEDEQADPAFVIASAVLNEESPDRRDVKEFWESAIGGDGVESRMEDRQLIKGFVEGALEIWNAVKDDL